MQRGVPLTHLGQLRRGRQRHGVDPQHPDAVGARVHQRALEHGRGAFTRFAVDHHFCDHGLVGVKHRQINVCFMHAGARAWNRRLGANTGGRDAQEQKNCI